MDARGAARAAPRATPLELVSAAVAGEDLRALARAASEQLGLPVAVVIPSLGKPLTAPEGSISDSVLSELVHHCTELVEGKSATAGPSAVVESFPVRIGHELIGVVAALDSAGARPNAATTRGWLEAAAAASAIAAMIDAAPEGGGESSRRALLQALDAGPPTNVAAFVSHARQLGFELSAGAVAFCARAEGYRSADLAAPQDALVAELRDGRIYGLLPLASTSVSTANAFARRLSEAGVEVALSAAQREPSELHDALREAELLLELGCGIEGREETYRLLVGILFRDPDQLEQLRAQTVSSLQAYDEEHDTELITTLEEFLLHHGSTTETAEAMQLHRHTVGYRLARVHEVSGLSPYESEGRERLSLGLKAQQILVANQHLAKSNPG